MEFSITCGLIAMLCWGTADFIQSILIRSVGTAKVMMLRNILTLILSITLGIILAVTDRLNATLEDMAVITTSSILYVMGYVFYMRGFEIGKASVVAPIASTYTVVIVALSISVGGESMEILQAIAVAIMIIGVFCVSSDLSQMSSIWKEKGIREAFLALGFMGTAIYIAGFSSKSIGASEAFFYAALTQAIAFLIMSLIIGARPQQLTTIPKRMLGIFVIHALLLNSAWAAYLLGSSVGNISIVAPVSSVFAGVTAVLAIIFMRERLVFNQYVGIAMTLIGVFAISI